MKDVPRDVPITKEVNEYLCHLLGKEVCLTYEYEGDPLKDGANLTTSTGENVNDMIKQRLIPSWKREDYDGNKSSLTYATA